MIVKIRESAQGVEYWDTKELKSLFVCNGQEPYFEVTENPESMLVDEDSKDDEEIDQPDFSAMTVNELKSYAAELSIEIPEDVKKRDDIIKFLSDGE